MLEVMALEPKSYDQVLGNAKVVAQLKALHNTRKSIILFGKSGIGKSCLGRIYLGEYREVSGTVISSDEIRNLRGHILINELDAMDKRKQKLLISLIDNEQVVLVGTTVSGKASCIPELQTRCSLFYVNYPNKLELNTYISNIFEASNKSISTETINKLYSDFDNLRSLNTMLLYLIKDKDIEITEDTISKYREQVHSPMNNLEEVKSALQKSIRGSDVDASCMYASNLLKNGFLEEMCRRLRVIASEDIGLANPNCIVVVNACIDSALKLGLPEAYFPVMQAVAFMALQPKSNSLHLVIDKCKSLPEFLRVPKNINSVHPTEYLYPHNYRNNWVEQKYKPMGLENMKVYSPGCNKIEQGYKRYWETVKGGKSDGEKE